MFFLGSATRGHPIYVEYPYDKYVEYQYDKRATSDWRREHTMKLVRKWVLSVLFILFFSPLTWAANTTHDVVIVGAGSAGLYAAKTLTEDGYDVLIIEATNRIGGACLQFYPGGYPDRTGR